MISQFLQTQSTNERFSDLAKSGFFEELKLVLYY